MSTHEIDPTPLLGRLEAEATCRGLTVEAIITELAAQLPADRSGRDRKLSFVGIGASLSGRTARDADEMLAEGFGRD